MPRTNEIGELIPADEMERIRNYLAQWAYTVGTETPEGVPLAKQLLRHIDALDPTAQEKGTWGLPATHRYYAPGVWLPKVTTPVCPETFGPWACACARGHEGPHRNSLGEVLDA